MQNKVRHSQCLQLSEVDIHSSPQAPKSTFQPTKHIFDNNATTR